MAFCNAYKMWGFCVSTSFTVLFFIAVVTCVFPVLVSFLHICVLGVGSVIDTSAVEPRR